MWIFSSFDLFFLVRLPIIIQLIIMLIVSFMNLLSFHASVYQSRIFLSSRHCDGVPVGISSFQWDSIRKRHWQFILDCKKKITCWFQLYFESYMWSFNYLLTHLEYNWINCWLTIPTKVIPSDWTPNTLEIFEDIWLGVLSVNLQYLWLSFTPI